MQINDSPLALTVTRSREDFRRSAREMMTRSWNVASLVFAVLAFGVIVASFARQWVGAAALGTLAILALAWLPLMLRRDLRHLPDWITEPAVFRFGHEGVEVETPVERRLLRWSGLSEAKRTDVAWYFTAGGVPIILHRRTLGAQDEAAIEWWVSELGVGGVPRGAEPRNQ